MVATTGATDLITDGNTVLQVHNGHPMMQKITATGCSLSAVVAACVACCDWSSQGEVMMATAYAMAHYGLAGEEAAKRSKVNNDIGPGSLRIHLIDMLHCMQQKTVEELCKVDTKSMS